MKPPIFPVIRDNAAVQAAFGASPVRVFPFGQAPDNVADPYCVWRIQGGSPENYLGDLPDIDQFSVQFDVYGTSAESVEAGARALRDAIEADCHIVGWSGTERDSKTGRYSYRFFSDWWTNR